MTNERIDCYWCGGTSQLASEWELMLTERQSAERDGAEAARLCRPCATLRRDRLYGPRLGLRKIAPSALPAEGEQK